MVGSAPLSPAGVKACAGPALGATASGSDQVGPARAVEFSTGRVEEVAADFAAGWLAQPATSSAEAAIRKISRFMVLFFQGGGARGVMPSCGLREGTAATFGFLGAYTLGQGRVGHHGV